MSVWIIPPIQGLIEPMVAPEYVVDGIGAVEQLHGSLRFYIYQEQLPLDARAATPQKVVVYKAVLPTGIIPMSIGNLARCMTIASTPEVPIGPWPRLVK